MIQKFEKMTLDDKMKMLDKAMTDKNWEEVKSATHTIKGSSGYLQ